jgi:two-component system response regulator FixJ
MRNAGLKCRSYSSATAFLGQLEPEHQGCIVTDIRMPDMDGLSLIRRLHDIGCTMPIMVITGHADVQLAVQAMKNGARDFIEKPFKNDIMIKAVRDCLEQAQTDAANHAQRAIIQRRLESLTERERQVFTALFEGQSNKEVAQVLSISPRTVEIYRANVMAKMQADSLPDLIKMMIVSKAA